MTSYRFGSDIQWLCWIPTAACTYVIISVLVQIFFFVQIFIILNVINKWKVRMKEIKNLLKITLIDDSIRYILCNRSDNGRIIHLARWIKYKSFCKWRKNKTNLLLTIGSKATHNIAIHTVCKSIKYNESVKLM